MGVGPTDRVFRFLWHNRVLGTGFGVAPGKVNNLDHGASKVLENGDRVVSPPGRRKRRCFNKEIGPINVYVRVLARSRRKIVLHQSWRVRIEKLVMRGRLWEIMRFLRSVLWMRGRLWILSRWKRCCSEAINFGRRQWASLCGLNRRKQSQ
ncbi:hypothetical protein V6N11_084212 [Hibiscus sabdariffa]|uniref:Uncharacterized protein n=2 Tax=Hibiscus sabdariffa TaxID=183260 RepID=A0ABR1ZFQ1_9ROSI